MSSIIVNCTGEEEEEEEEGERKPRAIAALALRFEREDIGSEALSTEGDAEPASASIISAHCNATSERDKSRLGHALLPYRWTL